MKFQTMPQTMLLVLKMSAAHMSSCLRISKFSPSLWLLALRGITCLLQSNWFLTIKDLLLKDLLYLKYLVTHKMPHVGNVIRGLCLLCVFVSDTNTACLSHCRLISLPSLKIIPQDIFSPTYFKWKCPPNIISSMAVCTGVHKTKHGHLGLDSGGFKCALEANPICYSIRC